VDEKFDRILKTDGTAIDFDYDGLGNWINVLDVINDKKLVEWVD